ncbi:MAG: hypothetical protein FJ387_16335 [Verrucomicrobia bacterium]|nr:hypothetical protein [Verrucomicrobiota bacterium]
MALACSSSNRPSWIHNLVHLRLTRVGAFLDLMDNGEFTNHAKAEFPMLPLGVSHNCKLYLDAEAGCILAVLNGQPILRFQHPAISRLAGPFAFWELYYDDPDSQARLLVERVLAAVP